MRLSTLIFVIAVFGPEAGAQPPSKRPIRPEDYYNVEALSDPHLSPDGKLAAYVVTTTDTRLNRRDSAIWLADVTGAQPPRQFTTGASSTSPRWSPDGRAIAFLSTRGEPAASTGPPAKTQIYMLRLDGGEARRITSLPDGASGFEWSPDGKRLACVSKPGPEPSSAKDKSDFKDYRSAAIKLNGVGYFESRRTHIFVVDAASGESRQITSDASRNDTEPRWSPDGTTIAYASSDVDESLFETTDILTVPASGGAPMRVSEPRVFCEHPQWSPDGKRIAYLATRTAAGTPRIWIAPAIGNSKSALLAEDFSFPPAAFQWAGNGAMDASVPVRGEHQIYRIDAASGKFSPLTSGAHFVLAFDSSDAAKRTAFISNDSMHPGELFSGDGQFGNARQVTHHNESLLARVGFVPVERITFKSVDDLSIDGFLLKPFGWQEGKTYPMIVAVHGGPNGMYGVEWSDELQIYAANGYAVFCTNPRGSSGYGEQFQRLVDREWGGKAYQDILNGVDAVMTKYPWIDRNRLGVRGISYGGFMTNWIVGHTRMFKAACALSSISDFISVEGDRDGYYGHARDFGGEFFEHFDFYWQLSPLRYAPQVKTPTLILHGDADQRVPLEQGEEWFRALTHFHVPAELVIFPREDHGLHREPRHVIDVMRWQLYWFDRYVNGNESAVRPEAN